MPTFVILLLILAFLIHHTWQKGKTVPSIRTDGPHGVTGLLLWVVSVILALALWRVYDAVTILSLVHEDEGSSLPMFRLFLLALPGGFGAIALWFASKLLTQGRTPLDVTCAICSLWLGGPCMAAISPLCYNAPYGDQAWRSIVIWAGISLVVTLYVLLSKRSRNTYGLF